MSDKGLFAQSAQDYRGIETEELILEEGNAGSGLSPKDVTG